MRRLPSFWASSTLNGRRPVCKSNPLYSAERLSAELRPKCRSQRRTSRRCDRAFDNKRLGAPLQKGRLTK